MTEPKTASSQSSLFARKGEAEPSPAVAYVSLRQLQGKPDRRDERPEHRRDQRHPAKQGSSPEVPGQRSGERRHYTPASGLAFGQPPEPWRPDASQAATAERGAAPGWSPLSSLIVRHGVAAPPPEPPPARTKIDPLKYLSTAGTGGRRTAAAPSPAEPCKPLAAKRSTYRKRKKLTLRLGPKRFEQFEKISKSSGRTYQSILSAAITAYLKEKT